MPEGILGIVQNGSFISAQTKKQMLLTTVKGPEAVSPQSGKIDLTRYEGMAIMASGQGKEGDEILYGAEITETAGLILTLLVKKTFKFNL